MKPVQKKHARTILLTGASGFVGRAVSDRLRAEGYEVRAPGRRDLGPFDASTDWSQWVDGADVVIHLAGRAHVMKEDAEDPLSLYRRVNRDATLRLAEQAKAAGVARFVFMSTVKVMGDVSDHPLTACDPIAPPDAYSLSKAEAEKGLSDIYEDGLVIIRPPLVYGPGVKGNFLNLLRLVSRGIPLPLGSIRNARSLIYVENLADCVHHSIDALPGIYLPSDGKDVSTARLVSLIAEGMGRRSPVFPFPPCLLRLAGRLTGKQAAIERLTGSLTVDGIMPGWAPPYSMEEGIERTADWFSKTQTG